MKKQIYQTMVAALICFGAVQTIPGANASPFGDTQMPSDSVICTSGKYRYVLDFSGAPDLKDWTLQNLMPVMAEWYPKVIGIMNLKSPKPPETIYFELKESSAMPADSQGLPGYAEQDRVTLNATLLRSARNAETIGSVLREMVHVVQFAASPKPNAERPPAWIVKGTAEYVRSYLYEPKAKKPQIASGAPVDTKYDANELLAANFMDWVIKTYQKDLMARMTASIQQGYSDDLWKEWTGKTVDELGVEWKQANQKSFGPTR